MFRLTALATTALLAAPAPAHPAEARATALPDFRASLRAGQAPAGPSRGTPLRYAPIETDREHLSVGIAPPGARRAVLGFHYRLRLGDQRRSATRAAGI